MARKKATTNTAPVPQASGSGVQEMFTPAEPAPAAPTVTNVSSDSTDAAPSVASVEPTAAIPPAPDNTTIPQAEGAAAPIDDGEYFDPELVLRAKALGFSENDIDAYGDSDGLETAITAFNRRIMRPVSGTQQTPAQPQATHDAYPQFQMPAPVQAPAPPPPAQPTVPGFKAEVSLDSADYNEDVVKAINKINDHYAAQMENMNRALGGLTQHAMDQQKVLKRNRVERFDEARQELDGWDEVLGTGSIFTMDPKSETFRANEAVYDAVERLEAGFNRDNLPVPSYRRLLSEALTAEFSDVAERRVRRNLSGKLERRKGQMSTRPSRREGSELTGHERAVAVAIKAFDEHNVPYAQQHGVDPLQGL